MISQLKYNVRCVDGNSHCNVSTSSGGSITPSLPFSIPVYNFATFLCAPLHCTPTCNLCNVSAYHLGCHIDAHNLCNVPVYQLGTIFLLTTCVTFLCTNWVLYSCLQPVWCSCMLLGTVFLFVTMQCTLWFQFYLSALSSLLCLHYFITGHRSC